MERGEGRAFEAMLGGGISEGPGEFGVTFLRGEIGERDHRRRTTGVLREGQAEFLVELVLEAEPVEQLEFLDVREGRLLVGRDALLCHRQRHLVLAEEDMEAGELGKNRVTAGPFERGRLRLE